MKSRICNRIVGFLFVLALTATTSAQTKKSVNVSPQKGKSSSGIGTPNKTAKRKKGPLPIAPDLREAEERRKTEMKESEQGLSEWGSLTIGPSERSERARMLYHV